MPIRTPRRPLSASVAATVALLALVACTPGDTATDDTSDTTLLPAAEGATQYPLTLTSAWGSTVLEERPERVLAIDIIDAELIAALSATPAAVVESIDDFGMGYIADAYPAPVPETMTPSGDWPSVPLEAIAAMEPDLIVVTARPLDDTYDALAAIAPVLAAPTTDVDDVDWRASIEPLGAALDLSDAAAGVVADNARLYEDAAAAHPEFAGRTIAVLGYWADGHVLGNLAMSGSQTESIFLRLGFAPHPAASEVDDMGGFSLENIALFDADVMFLGLMMGTGTGLEDSPLFQGMSVVRDDHVLVYSDTSSEGTGGPTLGGVPIDYDVSRAIQFSGPISERFVVETLVDPLSATMSR